MQRRNLLRGAAALATSAMASSTLATPALAQGAGGRVLRFVPQANLTSLDPVWTTATVTRNYALMVFDTLFGLDADLRPAPQMVEGHDVADDGRRWTMRLREGLVFHDGTKVLAADCRASLLRWMKRDPVGQSLASRLDGIETPDDRTLVFRLSKPFPSLPFALAKTQPSPPVIMPERIARTDPFTQITEVVGSGPYRFVAGEFVSGNLAVFTRFDQYKPREEAPSFTAGARRALIERIEWKIIPEQATAANALIAGEVDWLEIPLPDLLPMLRRDRGVVVGRLDPIGLYPVCRPNMLSGPTANPGVRRAILAAIDQREVMQAVMGEDASSYAVPTGCFLPGTTYASPAGMDLIGPKPAPAIKAMLDAAKYDGSPVVLMHPTDQPFYDAMSQVIAASLKRVGIAVDDQAMDWGTVVQRRASKKPVGEGGWSLFCTSFPAADYIDPLSAPALRGNGGAAWYGWPTDEKLEQLRDAWLDSPDAADRKRLAAAIQLEALANAQLFPLGQYFQSAAWRTSLSGFLKGPAPVFWNVAKA
jgi:peptide/nickel transport system substrate-binding protein